MTPEDAAALELFIKDHDTRFVPKAMESGGDSYVLLKRPENGEELEVRSIEDYGREFIASLKPGPTIETAWDRWRGEH